MIQCQICGKEFQLIHALSTHLSKHHTEITKQEYYDKFLLKDKENQCCIICKNPTTFFSLSYGYKKTCKAVICVVSLRKMTKLKKYGDENYHNPEKTKQTCLEKYGCENPLQVKNIRDKIKQTCLERYDVENPFQAEMFKEKCKKTKLEKYGDENFLDVEKSKKTKLEKYGDENYNNRAQMKMTKLKKYGDKNYNNQIQMKLTCLEKYGYENTFQVEKFKEKSKETCLEKYNVEHPSQSEEVREKMKKSCKENNGVEYALQNHKILNKMRQTNLKRHGDKNYNNREKSKITCMEKYGVESPAQVTAIHEKQQKYRWKDYKMPSGKIIKLQGYENRFLDEYFKKGNKEDDIVYQRKLMPEIWYFTKDENKHRYFPDFYIPKDNLIIEVKSVWTMKKYLEKNLLKRQACIDSGYNFEFNIYNKISKITLDIR